MDKLLSSFNFLFSISFGITVGILLFTLFALGSWWFITFLYNYLIGKINSNLEEIQNKKNEMETKEWKEKLNKPEEKNSSISDEEASTLQTRLDNILNEIETIQHENTGRSDYDWFNISYNKSFSQGCLKYGNYDTCEKFDNKYLECRLCLQECIHRSNFPKY